MAKKSNKTAHVLSLLTGKGQEPTAETESEKAEQNVQHSNPLVAEAQQKSRQHVAVEKQSDDPLSLIIKEELEKELLTPEADDTATTTPPEVTEADTVDETQAEIPATAPPQNVGSDETVPTPPPTPVPPQPQPLPVMVQPTTQGTVTPIALPTGRVTPLASAMSAMPSQPTPQPTQPTQPTNVIISSSDSQREKPSVVYNPLFENFDEESATMQNNVETGNINLEEELPRSAVPSKDNVPPAGADLVTVNIMEELVYSRVPEMMTNFGVCTCPRCLNDVIALTLNMLPPKYVVTLKGQLFSKLATYANQHNADLFAAATKAFMMVSENPRHD